MKSILLIGNKGSFLSECSDTIRKSGVNLNVLISSDTSIDEVSTLLKNASSLVYIGGETRNELKMQASNIDFPYMLAKKCCENKVRFIYLSSLSVYGDVLLDEISIETKREPLDKYGESKNKFDQLVCDLHTQQGLNYLSVIPASIRSGNGRSSIEKLEAFFSKFPILRLFKFQGSFAYIERENLIKILEKEILSDNNHSKFFIASNDFELKNLSYHYSIPIPKIPIFLFSLLKKIIGRDKSFKLRMFIRGIKYRNL